MKPGIYDIGSDAYHADAFGDQPTFSSSIARIMVAKSPAHARAAHPRLNLTLKPPTADQRERFEIGRATHELLLEGHALSVDVFNYVNWKTKPAQEDRALCRQHGRVPMLGEKWDDIEAMVESARAKLGERRYAPPLFKDGTAEQTLVWEEAGVVCKARLDWLRTDLTHIDDLKTATNANPEKIDRVIADHGYHIQAVLYKRGLKALTGADAEFRFCFLEKDPPYEVAVAQLAPSAVALAETQIDWALAAWKRGLNENHWPGYAAEVCHVELPAWEESRWLEREAREEMAA